VNSIIQFQKKQLPNIREYYAEHGKDLTCQTFSKAMLIAELKKITGVADAKLNKQEIIIRLESLYEGMNNNSSNNKNSTKNNNNDKDNDKPKLGARIEVYFSSGLSGWYRGTYVKEKKEDVIKFDDGDSQSIQKWSKVLWRPATSKKTNKNSLI
jgi:hypothetical protein